MAYDVFPAAYCPTSGTSGQTAPRVLRAQFGDGYMQSVLDGLNAYLRKWSLTFEPINAATGTISLKLINTWFEQHAGQRFQWVQPPPFDVEGAKVFECIEWTWNYQTGLIVGLQATFEQRPET